MEGHGGTLIRDVGISIVGAAAAALAGYLCRVPLMLTYLAAGVALGPHLGFGLVKEGSISTVSSIGLILLMFILGLEIDIKKLLQAGKAVLVNGVTQFVGCFLLAWLFFWLMGYGNKDGRFELAYLAVACSLSSTLIAVKILSDRMELDTLTSRITLGILVLQDLWAIAFLAVQPNLKDLGPGALATSAGKALILVLVSAVASRFILPHCFRAAARVPELVIVLAMGWCFVMCGVADKLNLSLEMGALVAGVGIASFPYHMDIATKISALRDFFITLFFVGLGLQIPMPTASMLTLAGLVTAFCLVSRVLMVYPVLYLLRYGNRASLVPGINLSQLSEFALVLAALGASDTLKHVAPEMVSAFVLGLAATALISSLVIPHGHRIAQILNPFLEKIGFKDAVSQGGTQADDGHGHGARIVLLGFYREGSSLLNELLARHEQICKREVLVVDFNPEAHRKLGELGVRCVYGDLSHPDTFRHLELDKAEVLICTIPDHVLKGITNRKLLAALKAMAPEAKIIMTAEQLEEARAMYAEGAFYVFAPRLAAADQIADIIDHIHAGTEGSVTTMSRDRFKDLKEVIA